MCPVLSEREQPQLSTATFQGIVFQPQQFPNSLWQIPRGCTSTSCPSPALAGMNSLSQLLPFHTTKDTQDTPTSTQELRDPPGGSRNLTKQHQQCWRIPGITQGLIFQLLFPLSFQRLLWKKPWSSPRMGRHMWDRAGGICSFGSWWGSPRSAAGTQRKMSTILSPGGGEKPWKGFFFFVPCHVSGFTLLVLALPRKEIK